MTLKEFVTIPELLTLTQSLRGSREVTGHYQVFRLIGLLDAYSEPNVRKAVGKAIEEGPVNVILDLSSVDFIDSTGVGALVQLAKQIQNLSGTIQIVSNPRITQTIKLVRLEKFLSLQPSLDEAIAHVPSPKG